MKLNDQLFCNSGLCGMILISITAFPYTAQAQSVQAESENNSAKDSPDVDVIVVTARKSIETPMAQIKRNYSGIVDSVTMSQIEKTADITLPEALERVAGVSSDAYLGSASAGYSSIRGFDSRYNSIDIDGNPIWFSSQNNRGAQSGLIPTAIIKEASVYKTVTPDMDANSIGGHISLRSLRAFDGGTKPYFIIGGNIGKEQQKSIVNDRPDTKLYSAGKLTFGSNNKFGFVYGINYQRSANSDIYGGVDGYTQINGQDQVSSYLYDNSLYDKYTENTAIFVKFESRITDKLYAFVSGNYFDEDRSQYLNRTSIYISNTGGRTITQTGSNTANFTNGTGSIREYDYDVKRRAKVIGLGVDYKISNKGTVSVRGNYTDYTNNTLTRSIAGSGFQITGLNGAYDLNGDKPSATLNDYSKYNVPSNWLYSNNATSTYNRYQPLKDKVSTFGANYNYNSFASARGIGVSSGLNWVRLDRSFNQDIYYYILPNGKKLYLSDVIDNGGTMENNAAVMQNWDKFWQYIYSNASTITYDQQLTADYLLTEDTYAFYAALNYSADKYKIIAGVRYEKTDDITDTARIINNVATSMHRNTNYDNWLPNVQALYDFKPNLRLRAAFTKTIGRPDFADFAPGISTSIDTNGLIINTGTNPDLKPRISTNYDLSLEYYLKDGILSLAAFNKDIDNETFTQKTEIRDNNDILIGYNSMVMNNGNASMNGFEINFVKSKLDFLPDILQNLGVSANYTYLQGKWNVVFSNGTQRTVNGLRNQPQWLGNLQLSYDSGPLDINLNFKMRGRSFTGTFGTSSNGAIGDTWVGDRWIEPYNTFDINAKYSFSKHLKISFDVKNITNNFIKITTGPYRSIYNSVGSGKSYILSVSYKY